MINSRIPLRYKNMLIDMVDDVETKKEIKYKAAEVMRKYPLKYRMKFTLDEEGNMAIRFIFRIKTKFDWNSLLEGDAYENRKEVHHSLTSLLHKFGRSRFKFTTRHFGNIEVLNFEAKVKNGANFKGYYKDTLAHDPDMIFSRDLERLAIDSNNYGKEIFKGLLLCMVITEILANVIVYQRDLYFEDLKVMEIIK